jgi:hypothetical protein
MYEQIDPGQIFLAQCKAERTLSPAAGSLAQLLSILRLPYISSDVSRQHVTGLRNDSR